LPTLVSQKTAGKLTEEKAQLLQDMSERKDKLEEKNQEINEELKQHNDYLETLEYKGRVCAEDTIYPGVELYVKDERFLVKDEYHFIKFSRNENQIELSEYEPPEITDKRMIAASPRRRR